MSPRDPPIFAYPALEFQVHITMLSISHSWILLTELKSSCFQDKHFADQVIFPGKATFITNSYEIPRISMETIHVLDWDQRYQSTFMH